MAVNSTFKLYSHLERRLSSVDVNSFDEEVQIEKLSRIFSALDDNSMKYLSTVIGMLIVHHERVEEKKMVSSKNWRPLYGFEQRGNDIYYRDITQLPLRLRHVIYLFIDDCIG